MNGKILDYNSELKSGLIRGNDGNKYRFSIDDCKSDLKPRPNAEVDFEPSSDKATEIYILTKDSIDDIKDLASSVVGVTTNTVKASTGKIKKVILTVISIGILGFIIVVIINLAVYYNEKQEILKTNTQISELVSEGDRLLRANDFQNAVFKYEAAKKIDPYSDSTYRVPTGWRYDYKMAECYLGMDKPKKALSLIGNPVSLQSQSIISNVFGGPSHFTSSIYYPEEYDKSRKSWMCKIASKAYQMLGDKFTTEVYAHGACENGDCSLVEK